MVGDSTTINDGKQGEEASKSMECGGGWFGRRKYWAGYVAKSGAFD
jgi:hypothetical protein